jgi:hypothetical protein
MPPVGIQKLTIQRNWQHRGTQYEETQKITNKNGTICVGHHYTQTNTTNVNKT